MTDSIFFFIVQKFSDKIWIEKIVFVHCVMLMGTYLLPLMMDTTSTGSDG